MSAASIGSRFTRQQRYLILVIAIGAIVLAGIGIARRIDLSRSTELVAPAGRELIVSAIALGTPLNENEATKEDPRLRQQNTYTTATPLALRLTTDPAVTNAYTVSVRLITASGSIVELSPSPVTFQPGISTFCCWQVDTPGHYTLQIFRPERVITSLPLVIEPASQQPRPLL